MDRYFFHLQDAAPWRDEEGVELENLAAAKRHAVQHLAERLCRRPDLFWNAETYEIRVTDANDLTLFVVSMIATLGPAISQTADISALASAPA